MLKKSISSGGSVIRPNRAALFISVAALVVNVSCTADRSMDSFKDTADIYSSVSDHADDTSSEGEQDFYSVWAGEMIDPTAAHENGLAFIGDNCAGCEMLWDDFVFKVENGEIAELTVCTEDSVTSVDVRHDNEIYSACVRYKNADGEGICEKCSIVSPPVPRCVKNGRAYEYYIGDRLVYTRPDGGLENNGDHEPVPAEFDVYPVQGSAAVAFPYKKTFCSYSDFEDYREKYSGELDLEEIDSFMREYDKNGGFNAHVLFLYADMAVSENVSYEFLGAVRNGERLELCLKKNVPYHKEGEASKYQFVCTVPGEYLVDVKPENVSWVVFSDSELPQQSAAVR